MKINILGQEYTYYETDLNCLDVPEADGFCRIYDKEIIVRQEEFLDGDTEAGKRYRKESVIRHELVHAFAEESGVSYGEDEVLVDWIAHMIPKINAVFQKIVEEYPNESKDADQ